MTDFLLLGAGGLLGRAVSEVLSATHGTRSIMTPKITWMQRDLAKLQLSQAVNAWLAPSEFHTRTLIWCAGTGTPRGDAQKLVDEQEFFCHVLNLIESVTPPVCDDRLKIFFASSSGGVYGMTDHYIATETSQPQPVDEYGRSKLHLEKTLSEFADRVNCAVVVGRISSLYGVNQDSRKNQGLLSRLANALARSELVTIHTSLTTTRNYLDVTSAARIVIRQLQLANCPGTRVRNICSPYNTSIAELLSLCRELSGRRPRIQFSGETQPNHSRIATDFSDEVESLTRTTLPEGLAKLVAASRRAFSLGVS